MRWSIVRLIWLREMRDQLRDRRTVFMIAVLPVLLYPVAGFGLVHLALGYLGKQITIGVQGQQYLPPLTTHCTALSPAPILSTTWAAPKGFGDHDHGGKRPSPEIFLVECKVPRSPPYCLQRVETGGVEIGRTAWLSLAGAGRRAAVHGGSLPFGRNRLRGSARMFAGPGGA